MSAVESQPSQATDLSVHMVLSHRDTSMALWSLRSFLHFSGLDAAIFIHDDGSLDAADADLLRAQSPRLEIISRDRSDAEMSDALAAWPKTREMRLRPKFYCALKLIDPWFYAKGDHALLLDSDVLFFQRPDALLRHARAGGACFNSDYGSAYAEKPNALSEWMGAPMLKRVNAGLMTLPRSAFDLDFVESYFSRFSDEIENPNRHEQTLNAMFLSRAGAERLPPEYQISFTPLTKRTVSHHYVNDGARRRFWTQGCEALSALAEFRDLEPHKPAVAPAENWLRFAKLRCLYLWRRMTALAG